MSSVGEEYSNRPATLPDYLAILRRRKWILIALPLLAALTAYAVSTTHQSEYKASAEVLYNLSNAATAITGTPNPAGFDHTVFLATQAKIARSPGLADRVVAVPGVPRITAGEFRGLSSAEPASDTDVLNLSVSYPNATDAEHLTNAYASEFARYKAEIDQKAINATLRKLQSKIDKLTAQGATETPRYDALLEQRDNLETQGGLLANNTTVLQPAEGAAKVEPRPRRNAILAGLLGAVLGLGLAFFVEALDKRVRSEHEIEQTLGLPLLGRVPRPGRRLRKEHELVMLAEPRSVHAETFRKLRTSLEFINFERGARTIMVTSAMQREGKSTTIGNLAVALARAGRSVALVDLDLRRPSLHSFFHVGGDHGITDVIVQRVELDRAIRPVALRGADGFDGARGRNGRTTALQEAGGSNGRADVECVVHLLPCGTIPPAADEFLEGEGVSTVLKDLSDQFDVVLVDAPPLLAVSDVMTLSTKVDAIVLVTHLGIHRRQLHELARQLRNCRAPILGFALTGVSHGDSYSYGYGYDPHVYDARGEEESREQRV